MANSEQQDILDGLVHIYECDEQHVSVLVIPTDNEIRQDLLVSIEDDESNTVYTTTTTDTYGMINTTFSLSPGAHTPTIKCGSNKYNIYDTSVICHACSLTLTSDKDILSAADGDIATLTATLTGTESGYDGPLSNREVVFEIYQASDNTFIETLTATTNSSGVATVSYSSQGIGDISITAKVGSLVTETYSIEDCLKVYTGTYLTGTGTVSQALNYNLPSTFEIEYGYKLTSFNQANSTYMRIGESDSKALLIGRVGNDSQYSVWVRNSDDTKHWGSNIQTSNDYQTLTITYDGSSFIFNNDITVTDLKGVSLSKLLNLNGWHDTANQGTITNIKIKPL